jgi:hypothetical protein
MEIGETVAVTVEMQSQGKCIICDKNHKGAKKETIKEIAPGNSNWHRKTMTGIFESDGTRETIYATGFEPTYSYQGHHCLALSSLVRNANSGSGKDKRLRLNYFLDKVGFSPNRPRNVIGLPARKRRGDFGAFWQSVDQDRPLQMHGPGHDDEYFGRCEGLLSIFVISIKSICEDTDQQEWENELRQMAEHAENYAFKKLANFDKGWQLHPSEQKIAMRLYSEPATTTESLSGKSSSAKVHGYGKASKPIKFPNLTLDTGPF